MRVLGFFLHRSAQLARYTASMASTNIDDLFFQTLQGDYDNEEAWRAVRSLQNIGTREVFENATIWCQSDEALKRARGADILGQLGKTVDNPAPTFPEDSFKALSGVIESETDPVPLSAALAAIGHLGNPSAIPMILRFYSHPDADVRFDLAFALGCFVNDDRTVSPLIQLMVDADSSVRDWATFSLGVIGDFDSHEIREALFHNLSDTDEDVREEAMVGLAKRKDLRSLPEVAKALQSVEPSSRVFDAANFLLERSSVPFVDASTCLAALRKLLP